MHATSSRDAVLQPWASPWAAPEQRSGVCTVATGTRSDDHAGDDHAGDDHAAGERDGHECDGEPSEVEVADSPVAQLRPLLAAAATTDLDDELAWRAIRRAAGEATAALVGRGWLPAHLAVDTDDPPALVTRVIAAAWKHVTAAPQRSASC